MKIGDILQSRNFGSFEIIRFEAKSMVTVRFTTTGTVKTFQKGCVKRGSIKDPYYPRYYGVGFVGEGKYHPKGIESSRRAYSVWVKMLCRCYNEEDRHKYSAYAECSVCDEWHCFQSFAEWYLSQPHNDVYEVDKDLLVKGNKMYSPENSCLLPKVINIALQGDRRNRGEYPTGVYYKKKNNNYTAQLAYGDGVQKHLGSFSTYGQAVEVYNKAKAERLHSLAEEYKECLCIKVYEALSRWEVI